jgi:hypothetical protein
MVAQIDEQHAAMVANPVAPARQPDSLVDIALTDRAAGMGPVTMHGFMSETGIEGQESRKKNCGRVYPTRLGAATDCA